MCVRNRDMDVNGTKPVMREALEPWSAPKQRDLKAAWSKSRCGWIRYRLTLVLVLENGWDGKRRGREGAELSDSAKLWRL